MANAQTSRTFDLAPMSPLIRGFTIVVLFIPLVLLGGALLGRQGTIGGVAVALMVMFGAIWIWCRPTRFGFSGSHLVIMFPGWRRRIPLTDVSGFRTISATAFHQEFGWPLRIGVGGLWGGFGWLWTSRRGLIEFYVSRAQGLVLVDRTVGKTLLITPQIPQQLVAYGNALLAPPPGEPQRWGKDEQQ